MILGRVGIQPGEVAACAAAPTPVRLLLLAALLTVLTPAITAFLCMLSCIAAREDPLQRFFARRQVEA